MTNQSTILKKPRRPSMTARRAQAIEYVARTLRLKSDARIGAGGLFGTDKESASMFRVFIEWADAMTAYRAKGKGK